MANGDGSLSRKPARILPLQFRASTSKVVGLQHFERFVEITRVFASTLVTGHLQWRKEEEMGDQ